jgi:hypothetical protein
MKTVRRHVLIREKEFLGKLSREAQGLYTWIDWQPLTKSQLEKQNMWAQLQGQNPPWNVEFTWSRVRLHHVPFTLYNSRYREWRTFLDPNDQEQLWMTPTNGNGKPQRLGIATLELEY